MKHIGTLPLIFISALVMAPGASRAQSANPAATPAPVLLGAEFHPGENAHYAFSLKMNLTSQVDPSIPSDKVLSFTPRQYQVEGEIVATFAPTQPGEPLRGTVQFQGLTVKNWVSSANVADLEVSLRQLESTSAALTTAADGNFALSEMPAHPLQDRFALDVEDLQSIAQAVLISRISAQPIAPGQQRESADFPIPGMVKPGIKLTTLTEYITDVPVAHHPSAEVRLSMNVPNQSNSLSSDSNVSKMLERLYAVGVWTYLLDLDAHQISFLHKTIRTETGYSVESTDSNEPIRIPKNLFTVDKEYEATVRRVPASASPEREADLTAFEKSLPSPTRAASGGSGTTASASPGGEASLGDIARRLRAARAAQESPQAEINSPPAVESLPAGFKREPFPGGEMTVLVPDQAAEFQRKNDRVDLRANLGTPRPIVLIVLMEINLNPGESADQALDGIAPGLQASPGIRVLQSEKKSINGMPAMVIGALKAVDMSSQLLQASVVSQGRMFMANCGTTPTDFAKVESLCRTVVESIRARQSE